MAQLAQEGLLHNLKLFVDKVGAVGLPAFKAEQCAEGVGSPPALLRIGLIDADMGQFKAQLFHVHLHALLYFAR